MNTMRYVYILRCDDDTLYTGITTDIEKRVYAHNHHSQGAKYTRARRPVRLVWRSDPLPSRSAASQKEYRIKQLSKQEKEKLIHTDQ